MRADNMLTLYEIHCLDPNHFTLIASITSVDPDFYDVVLYAINRCDELLITARNIVKIDDEMNLYLTNESIRIKVLKRNKNFKNVVFTCIDISATDKEIETIKGNIEASDHFGNVLNKIAKLPCIDIKVELK